MMSRTHLLTILAVGVLIVPAMAAQVTFRQGENGYAGSVDTFLRNDAGRVRWNMGDANSLRVVSAGPREPIPHSQTLIKFVDLFGTSPNQVPADQAITQATLRLNFRGELIRGGHPNPFHFFPMLIDVPNYGSAPPGEPTTDDEDEVTLSHRVFNEEGWGLDNSGNDGPVADEDYDTTREIEHTIVGDPFGVGHPQTDDPEDPNADYVFDITPIVADWYNQAIENYGLLIRPDRLFGFTGSVFHSNEWSDVNLRPELVIDFESLTVPGDANGDGMVDVADLGIVGANFNGTGAVVSEGDFNDDDIVDVADLGIVGANWTAAQLADPSAIVPEPVTVTLVMAGLVCLARRRTRTDRISY